MTTACAPEPDGLSGEVDLDSREALVGTWETYAPLHASYFGPYAEIEGEVMQLRQDGHFQTDYYLEIDGNGARGTLRVQTTGRWDRYEMRILVSDTETDIDMIDYQSPDTGDEEIYRRMDHWRAEIERMPLNNARRIRLVRTDELILIDGQTNVSFFRR